MKFYLVPIGEQFSFAGQDYTKSGPLTASAETDGKSKMIPRSANVKLLSSVAPILQESVNDKLVSAVDVSNAVSAYHNECLECLGNIQSEISKNLFDDISDKMNIAYAELVNNIK